MPRAATSLLSSPALALALAGCAGAGVPDGADAAVVGVHVDAVAGVSARACSGALVAPDLVLTARHCVAEVDRFEGCQDTRFGAAVPSAAVRVTTSASTHAGEAEWRRVTRVLEPPGAEVCGNDVALLELSEPIAPFQAVPLTVRLDPLPEVAELFAVVGFGRGDDGGSGTRRRHEGLEVRCVGSECAAGDVAEGEWRGDGAARGDSGAPALDDGGAVLGVASRGAPDGSDAVYGSLSQWSEWLREQGAGG
jgi:hypothetical protein